MCEPQKRLNVTIILVFIRSRFDFKIFKGLYDAGLLLSSVLSAQLYLVVVAFGPMCAFF